MTEARISRLEDEFEVVKQLLASAASYAESANRGLDQLTVRVDQLTVRVDRITEKVDNLTAAQTQTQRQLDQLSGRVDEFVFQAQRLFTQHAERLERVEGQTERLEAIVRMLDRNYQAQQSQLQEFQRTTSAALERIDRVLDYLLRQHDGS